MEKIKPRRVIDYLHRGKIKRFVVNVPISDDGYIRLDYSNVNINREHDFEWTKYDKNKLIKEYYSSDIEYKYIICVWWILARKYINRLKEKGHGSIGVHTIRDMYNQSVKEYENTRI